MFNFKQATNFEYLNFYLTKEIIIVLILAVIFSTPLLKKLINYTKQYENQLYTYKTLSFIKTVSLVFLLLICFIYIATDSYNPFIYFRF